MFPFTFKIFNKNPIDHSFSLFPREQNIHTIKPKSPLTLPEAQKTKHKKKITNPTNEKMLRANPTNVKILRESLKSRKEKSFSKRKKKTRINKHS